MAGGQDLQMLLHSHVQYLSQHDLKTELNYNHAHGPFTWSGRLTAQWPQSSQTSYAAAQGSKITCSNEQGKMSMAFYYQTYKSPYIILLTLC